MKRRLFAIALALGALAAGSAWAEPIYSEDFQSGRAEGWAPSGGDARLTTYAGNVSLRLTRDAAVVASVSTLGFGDVTIAAALAANDLEGEDYCLVEASSDEGRTWVEVLRIGDGQDDGVTMHRDAVRDPRFGGAERLLIGARIHGDSDDDRCWLDDVRVAGARAVDDGDRNALSGDWLRGNEQLAALAPMAAFAPPIDARAPLHQFAAVLNVSPARGEMRVRRDALSLAGDVALQLDTFPGFEVALVQDGDWLVPARRGPARGAHPNWEVAVEPGRVWSEARDGSWSRAALPFALIEVNANCTHNGVLTFVFRGAEISRVAWEIASETCAYFKFDFWGASPARIEALRGVDTATLIEAFWQERAGRMPVEPISALAPLGADVSGFASPAEIDPSALTTWGVVFGGVHYRGGCDTRAGPYPFCDSLLLPSYSLAKTVVAGFGLMRMELLHPGEMDERIAGYLPQCRDWEGVTLEHALDMATGRYDSAVSEADENVLTTSRFFLSTTLNEKLAISCSLYPRREPPGRRWVYHTPDTFVLGAAMQEAWRAQQGADRDFFEDVLVRGVYEPLHLSPTIRATRRTYDAARQPFTGWGLTMLPDDVAKLGAYLQRPESAGEVLMASQELAAAMQRAPDDRGLPAADVSLRYNNGLWAWNAQAAAECAEPLWIPFMSGFGGIVVVMMPNGLTYYYFSDGGDYRWARAVRAASGLAPLCERTQ